MKAAHITSNTFVGKGDAPSVLVVVPSYQTQPIRHGFTNSYEQEAAEVIEFLRLTFCDKTIAALATALSPIADRESK